MFTRQADDCWFLEFCYAVKPETERLKYWSSYTILRFKIWHNSSIQMHISTQTKQNTSLRLLPHLVQVMDSNLSPRSIPDWFCGFCRQMFYIFNCGRLRCLQLWLLMFYDMLPLETRMAIILSCIVCKVALLKIELLWACVCLCVCHSDAGCCFHSIMLSHTVHMSISPLPSLLKLSHYWAPAMKSNAETGVHCFDKAERCDEARWWCVDATAVEPQSFSDQGWLVWCS